MTQAQLNAAKLRLKAELRLARSVPSLVNPQPGENLLHELMHELRVSQIELEMQNEALRQSQIDLENSRDRYVDFYDFALVGYLTLSSDGMIEDINLPGAELLGVERKKLTGRRFASFVATADQDRWNQLFLSTQKSDQKRHCELALQKGDGAFSKVMLICQRLHKSDEKMVVRIVLIDVPEASLSETANDQRPR